MTKTELNSLVDNNLYRLGHEANCDLDPRTPPSHLSANGRKAWLAGWDKANSEG